MLKYFILLIAFATLAAWAADEADKPQTRSIKLQISGKDISVESYLELASLKDENAMVEFLQKVPDIRVILVKEAPGSKATITVANEGIPAEAELFYQALSLTRKKAEHIHVPFSSIQIETEEKMINQQRPLSESYVIVIERSANRASLLHYYGHYLIYQLRETKKVLVDGNPMSPVDIATNNLFDTRLKLKAARDRVGNENEVAHLAIQEYIHMLSVLDAQSGEELDIIQLQIETAKQTGLGEDFAESLQSMYIRVLETWTKIRISSSAELALEDQRVQIALRQDPSFIKLAEKVAASHKKAKQGLLWIQSQIVQPGDKKKLRLMPLPRREKPLDKNPEPNLLEVRRSLSIESRG